MIQAQPLKETNKPMIGRTLLAKQVLDFVNSHELGEIFYATDLRDHMNNLRRKKWHAQKAFGKLLLLEDEGLLAKEYVRTVFESGHSASLCQWRRII